jgi:hypothetical protein
VSALTRITLPDLARLLAQLLHPGGQTASKDSKVERK